MKKITHIFFDLDHTLWDYESNARKALIELMQHFELHDHVSEEAFIKTYQSVNEKMWHKFNHGKIERDHIKKYRFPQVLRKLKVYVNHKPEDFHDFFVANCCTQTRLMPGALEAMRYLKEKYSLSIITNGFDEPQAMKLSSSSIEHFFHSVITSETTGARKPEPAIFHHAMEMVRARPENSVMIGDNPKTDIRGASEAGMHAIFYNPTGRRKSTTAWQIESLEELIRIL